MSSISPRTPFARLAGILTGICVAGSVVSAQLPDTLRYSFFAPKTLSQEFEQQGSCVAVSGNVAVVGSPLYDLDPISGLDCGVVKIYDNVTGNLLHQLHSPSSTPFAYFGQAVAISGSKVVVGSGTPVEGHPYAGCVHVYDLNSATPTVPVFTLNNPDPEDHDLFGHSVAVDGNRIVVGAVFDDTTDIDSGRAYVYDLSSPMPQVPVTILENPSPAEGDCFGVSVAISGTKLAVAAYHDNTGAPKVGRLYTYDLLSPNPAAPVMVLGRPGGERNDCLGNSLAMSGSILVAGVELSDAGALNSGTALVFNLASPTPTEPILTLDNPAPQENGYFGNSVSVSGNTVVVGAYGNDGAVQNGGACYVYNLVGGTPATPVAILQKPVLDADDYFGNAVAVSGTQVVVGSWHDDTGDQESGISYVYDLSSGTPAVPVATLDSPLRNSPDEFGAAVAVAGDLVVVGSPHADSGATGAGRVSVYDLASSKPTASLALIENPAPAVSDAFGAAVAISGSYVVVGAPGDDAGAANAGTVYVYSLASGPPAAPFLVIPNPAPAAGDGFGAAVSISGNLILIGAATDDATGTDSGTVYVYNLGSGTPSVPAFTLANPSPAADDRFGCSVSISGNRAVVGAKGDDSGAVNSGIAYVYNLAGPSPALPSLTLLNPGPQADDGFGNAVGISGTRVVVGASGDDTGATDAGSAYVYDIAGVTPTSPVFTLPNPNPSADDHFGNAVAVAEPRVVVGAYLDNSPTDSGRVFAFNMTSPTPSVPTATLARSSPVSGDQFGTSVAVSGIVIVVGTPSDNQTATDKGAAYVFGPAAPEIAVQGPDGGELLTGGSADFGAVAMGAGGGGSLRFTILNTGITGLAVTGITVAGENAADFTVDTTGMPSTVQADDDASFVVNLNPSTAGTRTATLHIANSDSDESPFDIALSGTGLSPANDSDGDGLNDVAELRMAALGFNWRTPDTELVQAFQSTSAAAGLFSPGQVQALKIPKPLLSRNSGTFKLTMSLKKSTDLSSYVALPMTTPQTTVNPQGELEFRFSVPDNAAFFRLETK